MLKNYFIIACRSLFKNKLHAFISIGGLALGMTVSMLIGFWIWDELSFNKYHDNYRRIQKVMKVATANGEVNTVGSHSIPLGALLRSEYGYEFEHIAMCIKGAFHVVSADDKYFKQQGNYMEPEAPDMLGLRMIYGDRAGLGDLNSILLSESLARKIFANQNPVNQLLQIDDKVTVKVTGVYEDLPDNSEFRGITFILPFNLWLASKADGEQLRNDWHSEFVEIFVQTKGDDDFERISSVIEDIEQGNVGGAQAERKTALFLHPMSKWHLYSEFDNGKSHASDRVRFIIAYGIIGTFVLLLACINFMNLSTARSEKRSREVGIRKTMGSLRKQLVVYFFSESLVVSVSAFVFSFIAVIVILPSFNDVADKNISIPWTSVGFWGIAIVFTVFTGLLAGVYPAVYLSSFNPVRVLKASSGNSGRNSVVARKLLVVVQFTISSALIIGTIIIYQQIQFAKDRPIGYSRDRLVVFPAAFQDFKKKFEVVRNELKKSGAVEDVASSSSPMTDVWQQYQGFNWKDKDIDPSKDPYFATISVTHEYGSTVGWKLVDGRDFSRELRSDSLGIIINRASMKLMNFKDPIGQVVTIDAGKLLEFHIIGVVDDLVMHSPFEPSNPTIFYIGGGWNCLMVKLNPHVATSQALVRIEEVLRNIFPTDPIDYKFVDEEYAAKFASEIRLGKMSGFFAALAIIISCLGLFGLSAFVVEQRNKEIAMRKVLGASASDVWQLLSGEFVILVIVSFVLASPIAYSFIIEWLSQYEYRVGISVWTFIGTGIITLVITMSIISFQTMKAIFSNPILSLRSE